VIGGEDTAPDSGSADAASSADATRGENVTEGVWVGDATDVRVTVVNGSIASAQVESVTAAGGSAPSGSAGAFGVTLPDGPDGYGYAIALLLTGAGLGAVALGWSPWRSRRQVALLAVVGLVVVAGCVPPAPLKTPQPPITMHSQWGPDLGWNPSPDCAPGPEWADKLNFAVVHHTVNSNTYAPNDSKAMVRAIWQYHVKTLGYCDIAYNFIIDKYGQIFEGRIGGIDWVVVAAHTGGFNRGSTGIAFLGTHTDATMPAEHVQPAAWNAMVELLAWKFSVHDVDPSQGFTAISNGGGSRWPAGTSVSFPSRIVGHRDLWPTICPGNAVYERLGELRTAVQPKYGRVTPPA
jgi:hypothetical protein